MTTINPYVLPGLKGSRIPISVFKPLRGYTFKYIVSVVCDECGIEIKELVGKRRDRNLVEARQIISFILVSKAKCTLKYVGQELLGGRDHTTVIHSIKSFHSLYKTDEAYREKVETILNRLSI